MRSPDHKAIMASRLAPDDDTDFFPTPPWGARAGAEIIRRIDPAARTVWEPACGAGHMVHGLSDYFERVYASDAYDYQWGHRLFDFIDPSLRAPIVADWIMTNPPFDTKVEPFIRLAYARARRGVAVLLQLRALEGQKRFRLFDEIKLTAFAPFAERLVILKGRYDPTRTTATAYAWYFIRKPVAGFELPDHEGLRMPIPPGTQARLTRASDARFAVSA
jgi:hypothetical protein